MDTKIIFILNFDIILIEYKTFNIFVIFVFYERLVGEINLKLWMSERIKENDIIEAKKLGLYVISSELDYVRDIINPDQTFDPNSEISIKSSCFFSISGCI